MSNQERAQMNAWIRRYGRHPRVMRWLRHNPPPPGWRGSPEEYAYTEMPFAPPAKRNWLARLLGITD
jgi:hypothetical protein